MSESRRRRDAVARALHAGDLTRVETLRFWVVALVIGAVCGYVAIGFRLAIEGLESAFYGASSNFVHSWAAYLDWWQVLLIPVLGAVTVSVILQNFSPNGRVLSVADAIEAVTLRDARVRLKPGLASAAASIITLSTGGSTGREGPVVHLCAVIASWVEDKLDLHGLQARDILGCAVAAGVSASFNAPLAGALFALEVVLRHYAVHAFAPIVLASATGAVISRTHMGDVTEFLLPANEISFFAELPAFALLGVVAGIVAVLMIRAIFLAEALGDRLERALRAPPMLRAAAAGLALGAIAIVFPHIIGVGYETTSRALTMQLGFQTCVIFALVKAVALGVTIAGRLGGGVFSPSLMMGALTGAAFGAVATGLAPDAIQSSGLYALAGMGAIAAAVLGAPISTTLIVFELTGDYQAGIAVMIAVSMATVVAHRFIAKSFFLSQLDRAGVKLAASPEEWLPASMKAGSVMRVRGDQNGASETGCADLIAQGVYLRMGDSLAEALPLFDRMKGGYIPVVEEDESHRELVGAVFHIDALKAMNRYLCETYREEHS